jgi:hypothetical protein
MKRARSAPRRAMRAQSRLRPLRTVPRSTAPLRGECHQAKAIPLTGFSAVSKRCPPVSETGLASKNNCAGEGHQQFNRQQCRDLHAEARLRDSGCIYTV